MSVIYDIAGTSSDTFMLNGKLTFLQGDNDPETYQGQDGDVYFQTNGNIWTKINGIWNNLSAMSLPNPSVYNGKILYSNGKNYTLTPYSYSDVALKSEIQTSLDDKANKDNVYTKEEADGKYVHLSGNETINGNKTFNGSIKFNKTIQGTALNALWGDIAEYNAGDKCYDYGTLVQFGGNNEFTIATTEVNAVVANVETAALTINNKNDFEYPLPIVLCGRVKVKVEGNVKKFDKLYLSMNTPGIASNIPNGEHFGRALTDNANGYVLANVSAHF